MAGTLPHTAAMPLPVPFLAFFSHHSYADLKSLSAPRIRLAHISRRGGSINMESWAIQDHRLLIGVRLQPLRTAHPERSGYHVKLPNVRPGEPYLSTLTYEKLILTF